MGSKNGKTGAVLDGISSAQSALKDADVADKVEKLIDFIEDNAVVFATVAKKVAADVAREGAAVASSAATSIGEVASAGLGAAGDAIENAGDALEEEVFKPSMRYGKGLRHGLLIGAAAALLLTPWPGKVLREKLMGLATEARDIVEAFREGASEPSQKP
ncbi:MAG: hypothetical protein ACYDGR_05855 [Candidatus Dormibacteria bacterium]